MSLRTFTTTIPTRYCETDQGGRIHHSAFIPWLEIARTDALKELGKSYREMEEEGVYLVLRDINMKFIKPIFYDEMITIETVITELGSASITFDYILLNTKNDIALTATTKLAFINKQGKPKRVPDEYSRLLSKN